MARLFIADNYPRLYLTGEILSNGLDLFVCQVFGHTRHHPGRIISPCAVTKLGQLLNQIVTMLTANDGEGRNRC